MGLIKLNTCHFLYGLINKIFSNQILMELIKLNLHYFLSDPALWSLDDTKSWLVWTINQYGLSVDLLQHFHMDGPALSALSENYFRQKSSIGGDILYAQLDIWKTG